MASLESDLHPDGLPWLVLGHNRLGLGHSGLGSLGSGHSGLAPVALGHSELAPVGFGHSGLAPVALGHSGLVLMALGHSGLALMALGHSGQASLASEQHLVVCGGLAQQSDLKNKVRLVQLHFHDTIVCTPVTTSVHAQIEHCLQECRWYPWHAGGIHSM